MDRVAVAASLALCWACSSPPPDKPPTTAPPATATPTDNGCGHAQTGEIDPACCAQSPSLTISLSDLEYTPMPEGWQATMVHGPQGGWHVESGAWVLNVRDVVDIDVRVDVPAYAVTVADDHYYVALVDEGGCAGFYPQMRSFLNVDALADGDRDTPPELLSYEPAVIVMSVEDASGRRAEASVSVVLVPDPRDVPQERPGP